MRYSTQHSNLLHNVTYVPHASNFESGDSFFVQKKENGKYILVVMQVTVGKEHNVKAKGLMNIIKLYPVKIQKNIDEKLLLFIVSCQCEVTTKQKITTNEDKEYVKGHMPIEVRQFDQYISVYNITSSNNSSSE